jgi:RNA polymerase sigma-70 factor (ECF subfamily)
MNEVAQIAAATTRTPRLAVLQDSPDQALIERIAKRDTLAMQVLYARHHVRVYRFVVRLTGSTTMAEDLISEIFLEAWRGAARFEARSSVGTWLLAISRYKALSALRRRRDEGLPIEAAADIADPEDDPAMRIEKKNESEILRTCLEQLSPHYREVIDLVYYHEKSVGEVAAIVNAPLNTVKTRMFYARRRLSDLLAAAGIGRHEQVRAVAQIAENRRAA